LLKSLGCMCVCAAAVNFCRSSACDTVSMNREGNIQRYGRHSNVTGVVGGYVMDAAKLNSRETEHGKEVGESEERSDR